MSNERDPCRICGSKNFEGKITKRFKEIESTWVSCERCNVQRIFPYPTKEELADYYDSYLSKECPGSVNHFKRFSDEYKSTVFNEYACSLSDLGIQNEYLLRAKILDFGCANGVFLNYLSELGANKRNLFGIEIAKELADIAWKKGGYKVFSSLSELRNMTAVDFDLITLWDVIEHLENPKETITELKSIMKKDARVLIQTPRIGFLSECYKEEFQHYLPVEHIHLFPVEALAELFEKMGFEMLKTGSFGANAPATKVPEPYKSIFDKLAKITNHGATQLALFERMR